LPARRLAAYEEVCFFFTRFTVSRLSTLSSVCEDSRIFMYAASVSAIVLSYSLRDAIYSGSCGSILSTTGETAAAEGASCPRSDDDRCGADSVRTYLASQGLVDARETLGQNSQIVLDLVLLLLLRQHHTTRARLSHSLLIAINNATLRAFACVLQTIPPGQTSAHQLPALMSRSTPR
jgi:hypothetical protein